MKILVIGAHPDDPDIGCGGTALRFVDAGHQVVFVSCTNGATGHYEVGGIELARRRAAEAQASARVAGLAKYLILDNHTGELEPSVANRKVIICLMREEKPDLVITHRPNDYHPDHRAVSQLVQDASYIVTVPNMLPLTDALPKTPRICFMYDAFTRPYPFVADMVVPIDTVVERKLAMMHCHVSQMYEWLPYSQGVLAEVPQGDAERLAWLRTRRLHASEELADKTRDRLVELLGARGREVHYVEAFEACQYGAGFADAELRSFFPFLQDERTPR